jgi:hypothetical protein
MSLLSGKAVAAGIMIHVASTWASGAGSAVAAIEI